MFEFGFNGFSSFSVIFYVMFALVIGIFIAAVVRMFLRWHKNNNSPRLTVEATVVSRRQEVTHHNSANAGDVTGAHGYSTSSFTSYYATFQVESGDRLELEIPSSQYGYLTEGDTGRLSFQGTRFLSFERN